MPGCIRRARRPRLLLGLALIVTAPPLTGALLIELAGFAGTAQASQTRAAGPSGCSMGDRGQIWPAQVRTGTDAVLVPAGADFLRICAYNGLNASKAAPRFGLTGVGEADGPATVARLVRELDAIKPTPAGVVYMCPQDDESRELLTFGYSSGPSVVVTVGTNGCNGISNRQVMRMGLDRPVISQIAKLAKPVALWATVVGHILLCGGPAPAGCHVTGFNGADTIVATNSDGHTVARVRAHNGRFRFLVAAAGTYEFGLRTTIHNLTRVTSKVKAKLSVEHTTLVVFHVAIP